MLDVHLLDHLSEPMNALAGMTSLEPPDIHYLNAAAGWLGLGNLSEAKHELAQIDTRHQGHPDVLEARWSVCAKEENWPEALKIARTLMEAAPKRYAGWVYQAYALRRVPEGGIKSAWHALLPAFDKFPKESIISFNLSCYACQLGQMEAARVWLKRALVIGKNEPIKQMALAEPDLKPLWEEIKQY
jgi:tetratricopeptide (TPR) repeat protein